MPIQSLSVGFRNTQYTVMVLAIGNSDSEVARSVCHVYSLGFIVNLVLFSVML